MKLLLLLSVIFVANVSANFGFDGIPTFEPEVEEELERGFSLPLMWLTSNHSIAVDYDNITSIFNHPEVAGRKIAAVSIIGALRKGKSFFLAYCLRFMYANYKSVNFPTNSLDNKADWIGAPEAPLKGFSFRGGVDRHTTGVVMWSDVFLHEEVKADGKTEKIAIILMDTQGLFDAKTSQADNTRIFALGTLISSLQIFNLNDVLQENQLEYLRTATDYAQFHSKISTGKAVKPFQKLLFLIRDWVHTQDYSHGKNGGNQYIRDYLAITKDQNPVLKSVRDYMYNSFDDVIGFLLPHPGNEVTKRDYDGRSSLMGKEFKEHLTVLIESILSPQNLVKKRILDSEVSATDYGEYMATFFKIFQSKETPDIPSVYEAAVERQLGNSVSLAMKSYVVALNNHTVYSRTDFVEYLDKVHLIAEEITFLGFKSVKKMGMKQDEDAFSTRLKKEMKEYYEGWKTTSVKTWEMMQQKKKENENRLKALKIEQEEKMAAEKKTQNDYLEEVERNHTKNTMAIEAQNNLTWFEKEKAFRKLQNDKIEDENKFEEKLATTIEKLRQEAEESKIKMEANYKEQMEKMEGDGSNKNSAIYEVIERNRVSFMEMFKMQAEQQNADRIALQKRWDREDKLKADEIERLKQVSANEAKQRKIELERQEANTQAERAADQQRIESEQQLRKQQGVTSNKEREQARIQFQKKIMELKQRRQSINKAGKISSSIAVTTIIAIGAFILTSL